MVNMFLVWNLKCPIVFLHVNLSVQYNWPEECWVIHYFHHLFGDSGLRPWPKILVAPSEVVQACIIGEWVLFGWDCKSVLNKIETLSDSSDPKSNSPMLGLSFAASSAGSWFSLRESHVAGAGVVVQVVFAGTDLWRDWWEMDDRGGAKIGQQRWWRGRPRRA